MLDSPVRQRQFAVIKPLLELFGMAVCCARIDRPRRLQP
jgi:hypothetical protein